MKGLKHASFTQSFYYSTKLIVKLRRRFLVEGGLKSIVETLDEMLYLFNHRVFLLSQHAT